MARKSEAPPARSRRTSAATKEEAKPTRRTRAAKEVEEKPTRRTRAAQAPVEEAKPARRTRATKEVVEEKKPARRSRKATEDVVEAKPARRTRGAKAETGEEVVVSGRKKTKAEALASTEYFDPYSHLDNQLDEIERHIGLSASSMDSSDGRQSTGTLAMDLVLGGGITAGWYTNFGQEQSCKTTDAVTMLAAALNSDVPILSYFDFEGCLTYAAQVVINGKPQHLGDLFVGMKLVPYMAVDTRNLNISVETPCGMQSVTAAMYKGPKPCTRVELDNGAHLEGFKHKELVCTKEGLLEWKYIEDLVIGDCLVVKAAS